MSQKQKIWLSVSAAMFLIPEILWTGNLGKIIYYWILNNSVKGGIKNFSLFSLPVDIVLVEIIYLIEFTGVILSFIFLALYYQPKNIILKIIPLIVLGLLLAAAIFYMLFANSFSNFSFG